MDGVCKRKKDTGIQYTCYTREVEGRGTDCPLFGFCKTVDLADDDGGEEEEVFP